MNGRGGREGSQRHQHPTRSPPSSSRPLLGTEGQARGEGSPTPSPHPQPRRLGVAAALCAPARDDLQAGALGAFQRRRRSRGAWPRGVPAPLPRTVRRNSPPRTLSAPASVMGRAGLSGSQSEATAGPPDPRPGSPVNLRPPRPPDCSRHCSPNLILFPNELLCLQAPLTLTICRSDREPAIDSR